MTSPTYCSYCDHTVERGDASCPACRRDCPVEGWPQDALLGTTFEETYTVVRRLGSGGFGVVYLAENTEFQAKRALKVLDARHVHNDQVLQRFKREAKALYRLQSPYTVRLERWGRSSEGHHYLIMEFAEGMTLRAVMRSEGRVSERRALSIARQIAVALADANSLEILHRDLKPENIIVRKHRHEGDRVAVLDFGISKILSDQSSSQRSGLVGTPAYMPPEVWNPALGKENIRADLWALGMMMFEMLTGTLPHANSEGEVSAFRMASLEPSILLDALDHCRPTTRKIVIRLLKSRPDERYQTPEALIQALDAHPKYGRPTPRPSGFMPKPVGSGEPDTDGDMSLLGEDGLPLPHLADTIDSDEQIGMESGELGPPPNDALSTQLTFSDEPPESLRIDRSRSGDTGFDDRKPPSIGRALLALVLLGALALASQFADELYTFFTNADDQVGGDTELSAVDTDRPVVDPTEGLSENLDYSEGGQGRLVRGGLMTLGGQGNPTAASHVVRLAPFYLDTEPVSVQRWEACREASGCDDADVLTTRDAEACALGGDRGQPMTCITWTGARDYCRFAQRRLPTEAEWEFAARVQLDSDAVELGTLGAGLMEWVRDWYSTDYFRAAPLWNPAGPVFGLERTVRSLPAAGEVDGESDNWLTARQSRPLGTRRHSLGFRCVLPAL